MLVVWSEDLFVVSGSGGRVFEDLQKSEIVFTKASVDRCGLAFCYSEVGRYEDAQFEFERLAASGFSTIARDVGWLSAHVLLAEVCVSLDACPQRRELKKEIQSATSAIAS
jgi:hypothetical protein